MGKGEYLGEFEMTVLLALIQLGDDAYGVRIREDIRERCGRDVSIPTVYAALERLERKGHISSHLGESSPERGGRAKKFFLLENSGAAALRQSRALLDRMWEGIPQKLGAR